MAQSLWLMGLVVGSLPFLVISVIKGQPGCLSLVALFAAYQMRKQKSYLAGIILAFALIKPTVTVIPVIVFLGWALLQKNWRFLAGFASCMTVLLISSFLVIGNWIPSYFRMLEAKVALPILWSMEILSAPWNFLYAGLFIGILLLSFYLSLKRNRAHWFSAAILVGIAITPMRWIYDLFLSILILADGKRFTPWRSLFAGIAVLSPWLLVLVPLPMRWNVAVLGLPLIWVTTVLSLILCEEPKPNESQLAVRNTGD